MSKTFLLFPVGGTANSPLFKENITPLLKEYNLENKPEYWLQTIQSETNIQINSGIMLSTVLIALEGVNDVSTQEYSEFIIYDKHSRNFIKKQTKLVEKISAKLENFKENYETCVCLLGEYLASLLFLSKKLRLDNHSHPDIFETLLLYKKYRRDFNHQMISQIFKLLPLKVEIAQTADNGNGDDNKPIFINVGFQHEGIKTVSLSKHWILYFTFS